MELERDFLKTDLKSLESPNEYITQHNEKTKNYFKNIDDLIFKLLKIKEEDILIIKENLRANYIYIPE